MRADMGEHDSSGSSHSSMPELEDYRRRRARR